VVLAVVDDRQVQYTLPSVRLNVCTCCLYSWQNPCRQYNKFH